MTDLLEKQMVAHMKLVVGAMTAAYGLGSRGKDIGLADAHCSAIHASARTLAIQGQGDQAKHPGNTAACLQALIQLEALAARLIGPEATYYELTEARAVIAKMQTQGRDSPAACLAALERIADMSSAHHRCTCGRPTGVAAIEMCAKRALAETQGSPGTTL